MTKPPNEYGEWKRGNMGQVGRTVTMWHESLISGPGTPDWIPMVVWEPHPDEGRGDKVEQPAEDKPAEDNSDD